MTASAVLLAGSPAALCQHLNDKAVPCQHAADARRKQCLLDAGALADKSLNETYQRILAKLSATEQDSLRQIERMWVDYRDAVCKAESDLYENEADIQLVFAACAEAETRTHEHELLTVYAWRISR
jgi:uncharacterized protein YecT (DUF1311 family)